LFDVECVSRFVIVVRRDGERPDAPPTTDLESSI
jgi:hypothetical protein